MAEKKIIITGCGRSGTLYMSKVMKQFGLDVAHESMGKDGICSWYAAEKSRAENARRFYKGAEIVCIHLLRNPLKVISSMYHCELLPTRAALDIFRRMSYYYEYCKSLDLLSFVAKWWVEWNKMAEKNYDFNMRLKVEDACAPNIVENIVNLIGVNNNGDICKIVANIKNIPINTHTLPEVEKRDLSKCFKNNLTLFDLQKNNLHIAGQVKELAEKYGYKLV